MIDKPGFYPASDLPMAAYLADPSPMPSLSSGVAHDLLTKSPKHVWSDHPRLGGSLSEPNDASDMGTIAHDLLLGGEGKICIIEPADYRSKPTKADPEGSIPKGWTNGAIRAARDEAREHGLTPVLAGAMGAARAMAAEAKRFVASSALAGVFDEGEGEVTMIWREGPAWCKARPDWLNHVMKVRLHYKTTQASAKPEPFIRGLMESMGYDVALAFYRRGFEALTLIDSEWRDVILVQEQSAPYACSLIALDPAKFAIADDKVTRAIALWQKCIASGKWPAYSGEIHYASPTAWQLAEAERLLQEGL